MKIRSLINRYQASLNYQTLLIPLRSQLRRRIEAINRRLLHLHVDRLLGDRSSEISETSRLCFERMVDRRNRVRRSRFPVKGEKRKSGARDETRARVVQRTSVAIENIKRKKRKKTSVYIEKKRKKKKKKKEGGRDFQWRKEKKRRKSYSIRGVGSRVIYSGNWGRGCNCIGFATNVRERERERERDVCICVRYCF